MESEESAAKRVRVDHADNADLAEAAEETVVDSEYFESYDDLSVHILMLEDRPRVDAYAAAIRNSNLAGKTVLDVGAGSGVLSLLAAKLGGAARVYACEAAPGMARLARALAESNGLSSVVHVMEGRVEDLDLPDKVDAIISEWMGVYLLHESMLESVLFARQRWLKPGGLMLPSGARIWAVPVEAEELRSTVASYNDVHGLDLSLFGSVALEHRISEPQIENISPARLLASPVMAIDLGNLADLEPGATASYDSELNFIATRSGHAAGVALWFDVLFGKSDKDLVTLSTGPGAPSTHWKQTLIYFGQFVPISAGEQLPLHLTLRQSIENPRQYDIDIQTS